MIRFIERFLTNAPKPITLMETPTKMSDIKSIVKATAIRAIAAYDRAIEQLKSQQMSLIAKDAEIESLTQTILELQDMLDAKFPEGGSTGDVVG